MKIEQILAQIRLYPQDKDFRIKDLVFADLSKVINNYKDLIDLISIYPTEKNFRIKDFIFANLREFLKNVNDVHELIQLYPTEKNFQIRDFISQNPDVLSVVRTPQCETKQSHENNSVPPKEINLSPTSNIGMQILGGFIAVLGCTAVAIAFTALNAATLGITGLVVAGLGAAAILGGVGLFATSKNQQVSAYEPQQFSRDFAYQ